MLENICTCIATSWSVAARIMDVSHRPVLPSSDTVVQQNSIQTVYKLLFLSRRAASFVFQPSAATYPVIRDTLLLDLSFGRRKFCCSLCWLLMVMMMYNVLGVFCFHFSGRLLVFFRRRARDLAATQNTPVDTIDRVFLLQPVCQPATSIVYLQCWDHYFHRRCVFIYSNWSI